MCMSMLHNNVMLHGKRLLPPEWRLMPVVTGAVSDACRDCRLRAVRSARDAAAAAAAAEAARVAREAAVAERSATQGLTGP